jgi:glycosyltransferase involved in cell wall biosynthesis
MDNKMSAKRLTVYRPEKRRAESSTSRGNPLVSVVVSTYSEERFSDLINLLYSLNDQTYRNFEVIIVVEKSKELFNKLHEYVKEKQFLNARLSFNCGRQGLSSARNLGIRQAGGEIIAFIDDDALASPAWLQEMVKTYSDHPDAIGVTGPIIPLWESKSMDWCPKEYYWLFACTHEAVSRAHPVRNGYGANISFKKDILDKYGAFKQSLGSQGDFRPTTAEETELSYRLTNITDKIIIYNPGITVNHRVLLYRFSPEYLWERAKREGFSKILIRKMLDNKYREVFLDTEFNLLKRIFFHLIPDTVFGFFKCPYISFKKLKLTIIVLTGVAFGYLLGYFTATERIGIKV